MKKIFLVILFFGLFHFVHCRATMVSIGQNIALIESETGEVTGKGRLLLDVILEEIDIIKITMRYAPDEIVLSNTGNPVNVECLVDFYFPSESVLFEYDAQQITDLPVIVALHSGVGDRLTVADKAIQFARRGYTVLAPTYRRNNYYGYCYGYTTAAYQGVQDTRAAIRLLNKDVDLTAEYNDEEIEALVGIEIAEAAAVRNMRCYNDVELCMSLNC